MWPISALMLLSQVESPIKTDEIVTFFPTLGQFDEQAAAWDLPIRGAIYEPEANSLMRRHLVGQLRRSLGLQEQEAASQIFQQRVRAFLVDNERRKQIPIRMGPNVITLPESNANGHFEGIVRLSNAEADLLLKSSGITGRWIEFRAITRSGDERAFQGRVQLLTPTGISVISDIDDTIKISEVRNKQALLANTFLRDFRPVPGMADLYRFWASREATLHYVSASPWQLYDPLADFLETNQFPAGSLHLKLFRWKDSSFFDLFASPEEYKIRTITPILERFPRRKFILVGDSGEKDPEAYGTLARRHPGQIVHILIRDVTEEASTATRYQQAFDGVPQARWTVFRDTQELHPSRVLTELPE